MIVTTTVYDPEEEEGRRRPSHISKKEILIILGILIVAGILAYPFFRKFRRNVDSDRCINNLKSIASAIQQYSIDNGDRLPPVYMVSETAPVPKITSNQKEFTWITVVSGYMPERASFKCPGASDQENVLNESMQRDVPRGTAIASSYGMFGPLSAFPLSSIPSPGSTGLIADTSSQGTEGTYDPLAFRDANHSAVPDGVVIGFDNTNFTLADSIRALYRKSKYATRLAFPGTSKGKFNPNGEARHDDGVHLLTVDGHLLHLRPNDAVVQHAGRSGDPAGLWYVPY